MKDRSEDQPSRAERQLGANLWAGAEILEAERIAAKEKYDASVKYMEESNLPGLVEELEKSIPDKRFPLFFSREIRNNKGLAVGAEIVLVWDLATDYRFSIKKPPYIADKLKDGHKSLEIKFSHDGEIKVRGGISGSANLPYTKWKDNPEATKKALDKGYKHPGISR